MGRLNGTHLEGRFPYPGRRLVEVFATVQEHANLFASRSLVALAKPELNFIANARANATHGGLMEEDVWAASGLANEAKALNFVKSVNHTIAHWQGGWIHLLALFAACRWVRVAFKYVYFNSARALRAVSFDKLNAVAFAERSHSNDGAVHEEIIPTGITGNETKALLCVEPLYCSCLHFLNSCTAVRD